MAKREATERRTATTWLRMQRKRVYEANEALAEEDDTAPPTMQKPRHDAAATQPKKASREVKANFKAATAEG